MEFILRTHSIGFDIYLPDCCDKKIWFALKNDFSQWGDTSTRMFAVLFDLSKLGRLLLTAASSFTASTCSSLYWTHWYPFKWSLRFLRQVPASLQIRCFPADDVHLEIKQTKILSPLDFTSWALNHAVGSNHRTWVNRKFLDRMLAKLAFEWLSWEFQYFQKVWISGPCFAQMHSLCQPPNWTTFCHRKPVNAIVNTCLHCRLTPAQGSAVSRVIWPEQGRHFGQCSNGITTDPSCANGDESTCFLSIALDCVKSTISERSPFLSLSTAARTDYERHLIHCHPSTISHSKSRNSNWSPPIAKCSLAAALIELERASRIQ
jgi:hypothetical protein